MPSRAPDPEIIDQVNSVHKGHAIFDQNLADWPVKLPGPCSGHGGFNVVQNVAQPNVA